MTPAVQEGYAVCEETMRHASSNFYWGIQLLPKERRQALSAVYSFARRADDIADAADVQDAARRDRLEKLRREFRDALAGGGASPMMAALADAIARFSLTPAYLEMILDGAERDLTVSRYPTFLALKDYCRLVASSVGLVSLELFGCRQDQVRPMAENLGVALQLTNILRDVGEDARRGRIYLPLEDLKKAGCRESDILAGTPTEAFLEVCAVNAARAREHFESAHPLLTHLSAFARRTVAHMASVYTSILTKIESSRFPVLGRRVALSRMEKALILLCVIFRPSYPCRRPAPSA
ncbi:squalene/phytoene synthase family protein [bacterium]|nr:squalene/phytoene synthase family protein [bacterium]